MQVLVESRPDSKKAVIVVTDGKSNIGPPPVHAAVELARLRWSSSSSSSAAVAVAATWDEALYGPQLEIYGFGVADANRDELRSIVSNLPGHLLTMDSFNMFEQFATIMHGGQSTLHVMNIINTPDCSDFCLGVGQARYFPNSISLYFTPILSGQVATSLRYMHCHLPVFQKYKFKPQPSTILLNRLIIKKNNYLMKIVTQPFTSLCSSILLIIFITTSCVVQINTHLKYF